MPRLAVCTKLWGVIHEVDTALRTLMKDEALRGSDIEVAFDAPTKDWAARQNAPTVDVYLYDIREDRSRREVAYEPIRNGEGRVTERRPPARRFKLSYLVTAWTSRPEDEHQLLSSVLACFLQYDALPERVLPGTLRDLPYPCYVTIALPPPDDRSLSDVWSALGGELKPSLDLVITAPFDTARVLAAGPPVLEVPRLAVRGRKGEREDITTAARATTPLADQAPAQDEEISTGRPEQPGRTIRVRGYR